MAIISFISQKGGVGKSTLSQALAVEAVKQKLKVLLADYDVQQNTSYDWFKRRLNLIKDENFTTENFSSWKDIVAKEEDYDLIVVDGPARTNIGILELAKRSQLVIQPTGPSLADLKPAVNEFHSLFTSGIDKDKLIFVLNHIATKSEEELAREYLNQTGYLVCENSLPEKSSYRSTQNEGKSIGEVTFKSLANQSNKVIKEISNLLLDRIKE